MSRGMGLGACDDVLLALNLFFGSDQLLPDAFLLDSPSTRLVEQP